MASGTWDSAQCAVCGVASVHRCGPCGTAGFTVAFCSRAHQALVWSAHKRVCGCTPSKGFPWPPLDRSEVAALLEALGVPFDLHGRVATVDEPFQAAGIPVSERPAALESLSASTGSLPDSLPRRLAVAVRVVDAYRRQAQGCLAATSVPDICRSVAVLSVGLYFSYRRPATGGPYRAILAHRLLVPPEVELRMLHLLLLHCALAAHETLEVQPFVESSLDRYLLYVDQWVRRADYAVADRLLEDFEGELENALDREEAV